METFQLKLTKYFVTEIYFAAAIWTENFFVSPTNLFGGRKLSLRNIFSPRTSCHSQIFSRKTFRSQTFLGLKPNFSSLTKYFPLANFPGVELSHPQIFFVTNNFTNFFTNFSQSGKLLLPKTSSSLVAENSLRVTHKYSFTVSVGVKNLSVANFTLPQTSNSQTLASWLRDFVSLPKLEWNIYSVLTNSFTKSTLRRAHLQFRVNQVCKRIVSSSNILCLRKVKKLKLKKFKKVET